MIASHYAEPVQRVVSAQAVLRCEPSDESLVAHELIGGEPFLMLDDTLGWAWGYAGKDRRVGYVRSEAISPKGD